jgi:Mg/Co/Ni transporter MgtE
MSNSIDESNMQHRIMEMETLIASLKNHLSISRQREKKLLAKLEEMGCSNIIADIESQVVPLNELQYGMCPLEPKISFASSVFERGGWLVGLLIFQSFSSYILSANESLLQSHPSIIFFLTMLVGAGGNAGNQASVRVIRGLALGTLNNSSLHHFIFRELLMAFTLSFLLGFAGLVRALLSSQTSLSETFAICICLMIIVFVSIIIGATLPLFLQFLRIDPAHSSTSIQVIMDISGVLLTCTIASSILDTPFGRLILLKLGFLF